MFAGGVALFLYGLYQMGEGLKALADGRLREVLRKAADSPLRAVLAGAGVTALIQSSSATTVMAVQLTDAGILDLWQAAGIIMGANVGTCVTAWMLGAGKWGIGIVVVIFLTMGLLVRNKDKIHTNNCHKKGKWTFCPHAALNSAEYHVRRHKIIRKSIEKITCILAGLAMLFTGMEGMQAGLAPLAGSAAFRRMLTQFGDPLQGVFTGTVFTALIQSSSASVGVLQALGAAGAVNYGTVIPVVLGQNIGTCVTALLACITMGRNGKLAALFHLVFNVVGAGVFLFGFYGLHRIAGFEFLQNKASAMGIALVHTVFNLVTTAVLLPMLSPVSDF